MDLEGKLILGMCVLAPIALFLIIDLTLDFYFTIYARGGRFMGLLRDAWRSFLFDDMSPLDNQPDSYSHRANYMYPPTETYKPRGKIFALSSKYAYCWRCNTLYNKQGMNKVKNSEDEYICRKCYKLVNTLYLNTESDT